MIIGIGIVNPCEDNDNNEEQEVKEAKTCPPKGENCCEKKCATPPKPEEKDEDKPHKADVLLTIAEMLAEVAPEDHKPVLLAPSIGNQIVQKVHEILHIIMEADGMDDTCKVAAIGVEAMNRSVEAILEAIEKMKEVVADA